MNGNFSWKLGHLPLYLVSGCIHKKLAKMYLLFSPYLSVRM
jgi:hypothetical protein